MALKVLDVSATGENIRRLRHERELKVDYIAEKMGVTRAAVYHWEQGVVLPSTDNLVMMSSIYDLKIDDIIVTKEV